MILSRVDGGDDLLYLGIGDDTVTGGAGNDTIDGGAGIDIAIFSGDQADYSITTTVSGLTETITISGTDGTDTLTNIETLRFDDGDLDVRPAGRTIKDTGQGVFAPISGDPIVGGTLTAGSISGDPDGTNSSPNITYQWQEISSSSWADISGATSSTYSIQQVR